MERLVARVEAALRDAEGDAGSSDASEGLAERLKKALASNTIGGKAVAEERWRVAGVEADAAQEAWRKLGPVVGDEVVALGHRFDSACQTIQARRPAPPTAAAERPRPPGRGRRPRSAAHTA
jgi:hypothetical protein